MSELYKFEDVKIKRIDSSKYDEDEFMIARMDFLGTNPNSHGLEWDDDVFRESCQTFLGKWVVAEIQDGDATTHTKNEIIVGQIIADQEIEFVETDDGYLRAVVDVVLSKIYAKECCEIFENDDSRDVSVEIMCAIDPENKSHVLAFKGVGVTILGHMTQPSSKGSNIKITRFSEEDANSFYHNKHCTTNKLEEFAMERRAIMAESKTYKINKTELKDIDWGNVDKSALRNKIMGAKNRNALVKAVYALVEDGWEDTPSEHLKYPLMTEIDGTFYYVKGALSSALAYAKQHNEQAVIDKVEKLYKKFDLADDSEGKEEKKMSNMEKFASLNLGELWDMIWDAIGRRTDWNYGIEGIFEEANQKFIILRDRAHTFWRVDFDWDEENGIMLAEEKTKVEKEYIPTEEVTKFAEPEDVEKYREIKCEETVQEKVKEEKLEEVEEIKLEEEKEDIDFEAKYHELENKCQEQTELIMSYEKELEELRSFKAQIEESQKLLSVNEVLDKIKGHVEEEKYNEFASSAENYSFADISAWKNIVFAYCGEHMINTVKEDSNTQEEEFRMSMPIETEIPKTIWERLKQKYN